MYLLPLASGGQPGQGYRYCWCDDVQVLHRVYKGVCRVYTLWMGFTTFCEPPVVYVGFCGGWVYGGLDSLGLLDPAEGS